MHGAQIMPTQIKINGTTYSDLPDDLAHKVDFLKRNDYIVHHPPNENRTAVLIEHVVRDVGDDDSIKFNILGEKDPAAGSKILRAMDDTKNSNAPSQNDEFAEFILSANQGDRIETEDGNYTLEWKSVSVDNAGWNYGLIESPV